MRYLSKFLIVIVVAIVGLIVFQQLRPNTLPSIPTSVDLPFITKNSTPAPTPFEFQEMTIPALRSRSYESSLAELQSLGQTNTYTSYLTSYDSDGLKINGLLTVPVGQSPEGGWPAIVFVHGYIAPSVYQTTQNYVSYVDYLARNGFVVFKIDLRGHDNSEGEAGGAYYSEDYIVDTLNARAALQSSELVNSEKIGLWGHSMAGNVTFRSFVAVQGIPALVIWAGAGYTYEDLTKYGIQDNSYRPPATTSPRSRERLRLRELYGNYDSNSEFWQQVVPTNYLDDLAGAVQLNHAVDDDVVSVEYSRNLNRLLDQTDIKHELREYPTGGHNISGNSFNQAMQNTVRFFKENL